MSQWRPRPATAEHLRARAIAFSTGLGNLRVTGMPLFGRPSGPDR
jgi:hypothetical protein